jgi:hypothetical protein
MQTIKFKKAHLIKLKRQLELISERKNLKTTSETLNQTDNVGSVQTSNISDMVALLTEKLADCNAACEALKLENTLLRRQADDIGRNALVAAIVSIGVECHFSKHGKLVKCKLSVSETGNVKYIVWKQVGSMCAPSQSKRIRIEYLCVVCNLISCDRTTFKNWSILFRFPHHPASFRFLSKGMTITGMQTNYPMMTVK